MVMFPVYCSANSITMPSVLWLLLYTILNLWPYVEAKPCSGRQIYTASYGVITDGSADYPASAHCEWLIQGKYIHTSLITKTSYRIIIC